MDESATDAPKRKVPGRGIGVLGLAGATVPIAAVLTGVMGFAPVYPIVFAVTLAVALAVGGPLFLMIRGHPGPLRVVASGFVAGALVPAIVLCLPPAADSASIDGVPTVLDGSYTAAGWMQNLLVIGGFSIVGIAGALIAWALIRWLMKGGIGAKVAVGLLLAAGLVAVWLVPWAAQDRTCHNPLRDGRTSIGPVAEFRLRATMREWPEVQDEIDRFARENGWDVQANVLTDPGFPWFQVSVCREPGTQIFITTAAFEEGQMSISVYQPQGGTSWQAPLHKLQDRFERRWPGRVGYDYGEYSTPRPPWAPPSPTPADAHLHPPEKSL